MSSGISHEPESIARAQSIQGLYVAPGEGEEAPDPIGYPQREKAGPAATVNAYTLHEMMKPPGEGPPVHVHADTEEAFYVLDGEFTFTVGSRGNRSSGRRLRASAPRGDARLP